MYLVVIAWTYVVLMMSVAEATNTNGTLLGALITFLLYGVLPISIVVYLMGAPARNKAIKKRNSDEMAKAVLDSNQKKAMNQAGLDNSTADQASSSTSAQAQPGAAASLAQPDTGSHSAGGADSVRPGH